MWYHQELTPGQLTALLKNRTISLAGNQVLRIYGTLGCKSGKRMRIKNRVFFISEKEALDKGYRPCGHCLKHHYQSWIYSTLKKR